MSAYSLASKNVRTTILEQISTEQQSNIPNERTMNNLTELPNHTIECEHSNSSQTTK